MARKRGRPARVEGERASRSLRIWLTPTERRALGRLAIENGHRTIAAAVREAVNGYVADYSEEKPFIGADKSPVSVS